MGERAVAWDAAGLSQTCDGNRPRSEATLWASTTAGRNHKPSQPRSDSFCHHSLVNGAFACSINHANCAVSPNVTILGLLSALMGFPPQYEILSIQTSHHNLGAIAELWVLGLGKITVACSSLLYYIYSPRSKLPNILNHAARPGDDPSLIPNSEQ